MHLENFLKFIKNYGKRQKKGLLGFFALSVFSGILEFLGISLVYPFILLIINPEKITSNLYYQKFTEILHIQDFLTAAFLIGLSVAIIFIVKNIFMIYSVRLQNKFVMDWKFDICKDFMTYYIFAPYKKLLKITASEKLYNLTFLIIQTLDCFVLRGINLLTNLVIVSIILLLLFIKFPAAALATTLFIAIMLTLTNNGFKNQTAKISKMISMLTPQNTEIILKNVDNIKEIKILSSENHFLDEYLKTQSELNEFVWRGNFYNAIPPYVVEVLIVIALIVLAGIVSVQNIQNTATIIASYAIIIAAIFRIAPALNRIQISINAMNASRDLVKKMNEEYENLNLENVDSLPSQGGSKIDFKNSIKLESVKFSYEEQKEIIKGISLEIKKGEFIGIIGASGAGKSTLADIIMGLLPIDSGTIKIDEKILDKKNHHAMRKLISYVPQQINVVEGSFKDNVCWGIDGEIDEEKVVKALKSAKLYDFVEKFGKGINEKVLVGTNGLSQGQKQRLAIARAFYRNSDIFIFDEATSSLDVETEHEITDILSGLKGQKTIIAIAHRLSTLKSADKLVYLKDGGLVDVGTFEELSNRHGDFENLIKLSNIE